MRPYGMDQRAQPHCALGHLAPGEAEWVALVVKKLQRQELPVRWSADRLKVQNWRANVRTAKSMRGVVHIKKDS